MLPADFLDDLSLLKRLYVRCFADLLAETGLCQAEMDVLLFLANNPPYDTARDMVRRRGLAKSHVSAAVDSLVGKGLLLRTYRGGNRKVVHLERLPASDELVEQGRRIQAAFFDAILKGMTDEERQAFELILRRIHDNLKGSELHADAL